MKHGLCGSKIYRAWAAMKNRCNNLNFAQYSDYGGRGIGYCSSWEDFSTFYRDMGQSYQEGLELDMVDNNGNYNKFNCKWSSPQEQSYNKRKYKTNSSGKSGVSFRKDSGKWQARISIEGTRLSLGVYDSLAQAIAAREQAELFYFGKIKE